MICYFISIFATVDISILHLVNRGSKYSGTYISVQRSARKSFAHVLISEVLFILPLILHFQRIICNCKHSVYLQYAVYLGRLLACGLHAVSLCEIICAQHEGSRV